MFGAGRSELEFILLLEGFKGGQKVIESLKLESNLCSLEGDEAQYV